MRRVSERPQAGPPARAAGGSSRWRSCRTSSLCLWALLIIVPLACGVPRRRSRATTRSSATPGRCRPPALGQLRPGLDQGAHRPVHLQQRHRGRRVRRSAPCCSARWPPTCWPATSSCGNRVDLLPVRAGHGLPGLPGAGAAVLGRARTSAARAPTRGLILVYIAYSLPFTVFFLAAFFSTLPNAVAEAAMIDGASHTRLFFQIMLPMAKPGPGQHHDLQHHRPVEPVPAARGAAAGRRRTSGCSRRASPTSRPPRATRPDWSALFAALTLAILPMIVVYTIFQRQIQSGLTAGAVK